MSSTIHLLQDLSKSQRSFFSRNPEEGVLKQYSPKNSPMKVSLERLKAKRKYEETTGLTKQELTKKVWSGMTNHDNKLKKIQWSHHHYTGNNKIKNVNKTFHQFPKSRHVEQFPHNNVKHNIPILDRNFNGENLKISRKDSGEFKRPPNSLYSKHYRPIARQKRQFNEDWELRTSQFGKTWVDSKRDRVMDRYHLQANPFRTPRSNSLISSMRKSRS